MSHPISFQIKTQDGTFTKLISATEDDAVNQMADEIASGCVVIKDSKGHTLLIPSSSVVCVKIGVK